MAEPVELHEMREHNIDEFDWAVHGRRKGEKQRVITNVYYQMGADNYMTYLREKYAQIEANEQRWESAVSYTHLLAIVQPKTLKARFMHI